MKRRRKRLMVIIPFSTMTRLADNVLDVTMFYASGADETLFPLWISQRSWKPCSVSPTPCL